MSWPTPKGWVLFLKTQKCKSPKRLASARVRSNLLRSVLLLFPNSPWNHSWVPRFRILQTVNPLCPGPVVPSKLEKKGTNGQQSKCAKNLHMNLAFLIINSYLPKTILALLGGNHEHALMLIWILQKADIFKTLPLC